jgi:hypothetical protein
MEEKERAIARVTPPDTAPGRPTRYSPSSTASDCSDLPPVDNPATHTNPRSSRNNHDVGSIGDMKLFQSITICPLVTLRDREERRPSL